MLQGTKASKKIAATGSKTVSSIRSPSRENTTLGLAINAAGEHWKPLIIFKGKRVSTAWGEGAPPNSLFYATETSYMDTDTFFKYIVLFCAALAPGIHILFFDGHVSHISLDTIEHAQQHNLLMFQLPSHTSHKLQPLDVCVFGQLKRCHTKALEKYAREFELAPIKDNVGQLLGEAFAEAVTPANIRASFKGAGLVPLDPARAIDRLLGGAHRKRKARLSSDALPVMLRDITNTAAALGERQVRSLQRQGHSVAAVRVTTVMMSSLLTIQKRSAVQRKRAGLTLGGLLDAGQMRQAALEQEQAAAAVVADKEEKKALRVEAKRLREEGVAQRRAARVAAGAGRGGRGRGRGAGAGRGRGRGRGRGA